MRFGDTAEFIGGRPTTWTRISNIGTLLLISLLFLGITGSVSLGIIWVLGLHNQNTVLTIFLICTALWLTSYTIEFCKRYDALGNFLLQLIAGALIFGSSVSLWFCDDVWTAWYHITTAVCILNTITLSKWIHQMVN